MAKRKYSESERAAVNDKRAALAGAAKALEDSRAADIDAALNILSKYSRRNIAMILVQCEERGRALPAAVAGFHEWRAAGRIVRKGSQGYAIWAPVMRKEKAAGDSDSDTGTPRGFTVRYVFDVLDTDVLTDTAPRTLRELETVAAVAF